MTATYVRERTLQEEIAPAVEQRLPGVEVLAVELLSPSRFCVYVDHPKGVDHALCERVTRVLEAYRSDYTVDVSSPGPERPLRKPAHFASAVGRRVSVRTESKIDGRNRVRGVVTDAAEDAVTVETAEANSLRIPYDAIVRGNLIDEGLTT
ncbi:MAG: ribosome maturation factor RimP [Gaiellaceae bacterium]